MALNINVGGSGSGYGTVGRFNGISERGATVSVPSHGETTFSLPTGVANYNFGEGTSGVRAPAGVTVTRTSGFGGMDNFTITSR